MIINNLYIEDATGKLLIYLGSVKHKPEFGKFREMGTQVISEPGRFEGPNPLEFEMEVTKVKPVAK
jgi:hypothetical protein